jgi:hypothetical protein
LRPSISRRAAAPLRLAALGLAAALPLSTAAAGEGMWLPEQLPRLAPELRAAGITLDPANLADPSKAPLNAIISLNGYCSASFLSADGLVGTNHHCVSELLGYNSDEARNLARDGYVARSRDQELWGGPGVEVYIVDQITDVTAQMGAGVKKSTKDLDRTKITRRNEAALLKACEAPPAGHDKPTHRCRVVAFDGGGSYRLIRSQIFRDVRLAYAPPESVGSYGGEIDNWMWPRHAGDFALLRVYVGKDGKPAAHSADNVPYRPPHHLKVAKEPVRDGDPVLVAGYPGGTSRYASASALQHARDQVYPAKIALFDTMIALLRAEAKASEAAAGRLNGSIDSLGNGQKNAQGMLDNMRTSDVVGDKKKIEAEVRAWVAADKARAKRYGPAFAERDRLEAEARADWEAEYLLGWLLRSADLLEVAHQAVRLADERKKPEGDRAPGYRARDEDRLRQRSDRLDKTLWLPADRALMAELLPRVVKLEGGSSAPAVDAFVASFGGVEGALNALFTTPKLADAAARRALLEAEAGALAASTDPYVVLARALEQRLAPIRAADELRQGAALRTDPLIMEATRLAAGRELYPDANNTLRITFGEVEGYAPRDGVWHLPRTTVPGVVAKAGAWPFDAPARLLEAAPGASKSRFADDGVLPVNFLSSLDTTGGNSGSATLNKNGELVGFLFDGNYESMSADWLFAPAVTRSIHVDVRYLLWMLEDVENAPALVAELGFPQP